ncbi:MAG: glutamate N-acetyltransferase/amino-acid N-acetyltransferase [Myxococcota bacterium]|jgi:glutamate N-acetyltransferase/amino-acid N-acetyltransferase
MSHEPLIPPLDPPLDPNEPLLPGGTWTSVPNARCGVASGGIKPGSTRDDVVVLAARGTAAAVVTSSMAAAPPCYWTRKRVPGPCAGVVINAGNANAATGPQGLKDAEAMARAAAEVLGAPTDQVLVCSTGVIGVPMPMDRALPAIRAAAKDLSASGQRAAEAILTTDLVVKQAAVRLGDITVGGIGKGSGMIHPTMGTMLAFVAVDAQVEPDALQRLTLASAQRTFNQVSVDGDTSTNDTLIVQTTGQGPVIHEGSAEWDQLEHGIYSVTRHLAREIARDGEGATTLITVIVEGPSQHLAELAARVVARSPLVKTAIHGRDPNWGRIAAALGTIGYRPDALDLDLAGFPVLRGGVPVAFDEATASAALTAPEVVIHARTRGTGIGRAWGCDLTADYVRINADYRS